MAARPSGTRIPPELEEQVRALVREGHTRGQVARALDLHVSTVSRVVRDTEGLEFARIGQGSSGSPEAISKARGVQSEYARNRRAALSDRTLDEYERTLDALKVTLAPRDRQLLSQSLAATGKAYADLTLLDAKAAPDLTLVVSVIERFSANAELIVESVLPSVRPGLIQD